MIFVFGVRDQASDQKGFPVVGNLMTFLFATHRLERQRVSKHILDVMGFGGDEVHLILPLHSLIVAGIHQTSTTTTHKEGEGGGEKQNERPRTANTVHSTPPKFLRIQKGR
ncbi:MAG: hypothetical protein OXU73_01030 [Candidatus Campbellbacteria bacterium]|nr:hypothetical protein [Candidatus Campbellbacteria bacterium]